MTRLSWCPLARPVASSHGDRLCGSVAVCGLGLATTLHKESWSES
jgi:hypothetical protein